MPFAESDIIPFAVTLLTCLFLGLEYGMMIGIVTNLIFILVASARPYMSFEMIKTKESDTQVLIVEIHGDLKYSAAEYLKDRIFKYVRSRDEVDLVILKGEEIFYIDSTVAFVS